jgi:hypothetical protein
VNVNSVQSVTIRNLQASLDRLQKKTTAELAAARKQGEEGAARLNALEGQMSRVFPPATNKGRGKGKPGSDVLLETRVSDLEKAGAVHTSTAKSVKATTKEVTSIAGTLSKATKEIAKLQNQLVEASVAAPAAGHVQDVARLEAVNSNNTRIIEAALETLASFKTQLVDLQQKVSTIEVSMSPAAPESNCVDQPTAPNRHRGKRVAGSKRVDGWGRCRLWRKVSYADSSQKAKSPEVISPEVSPALEVSHEVSLEVYCSRVVYRNVASQDYPR